ncbi:XRE family transcriptional regulator [Campylobacter jejuni]|uniref:Acyl carrier protein n=1 Tax=Campylobacter jejuni TaxID=197 RepID=A0AAX0NQ73_CAMJU|nr:MULTISPECIES: hypothetical protein [Campylobacter]EAJ1911671.1 XRE family transcriptional regulator [Campylobacter jejuni]EAJ8916367.1 XRE family transcriptional regulator [Campylobacter jejuni]EAL4710017.1 XRE family transcriptional regulator [Campylobacter jejuni]EAM0922141.1 XRE family transcriptional regulator [Campylobacter jejuni]EBH4141764.1 XRE family transcriptional regulator [Campylobacter jejuni]
MDNNEFEKLLAKANLGKKEFSQISNTPYQTIMNWKRIDSVPDWTKPFLENHLKVKSYEQIKEIVFKIEKP